MSDSFEETSWHFSRSFACASCGNTATHEEDNFTAICNECCECDWATLQMRFRVAWEGVDLCKIGTLSPKEMWDTFSSIFGKEGMRFLAYYGAFCVNEAKKIERGFATDLQDLIEDTLEDLQ